MSEEVVSSVWSEWEKDAVLHCVTIFAGDADIQPRLSTLKYIERIVEAMKAMSESKHVLREAMTALARMAVSPREKNLTGESGDRRDDALLGAEASAGGGRAGAQRAVLGEGARGNGGDDHHEDVRGRSGGVRHVPGDGERDVRAADEAGERGDLPAVQGEEGVDCLVIHQQDVERCIEVLQHLMTTLLMSVQEMLKSHRKVDNVIEDCTIFRISIAGRGLHNH